MLAKLKASTSNVAKKASRAGSSVIAKTRKQSDQYLVGLDIGTEYVKALIGKASTENPGTVEIIGVGRAHQALTDMQAGAIADIAAVVENCDKALTEAEAQAGVSARTAIIGIAGELVKGTTTTVKIARKDSTTPIDIPEMEKIISIVQERAEKRAKEQLAWELGGKNVDVRLVNSALVSIEIDSYPVNNPIGFQGKDVTVQLYTAFAPLIHIAAIEKTAQELDLDLLAVAAEPFAVSRAVIGNDSSQNLNAILMDVGGGTSDIAVITDGGVQGTKMFGIGGRAFTRGIERELGVSFEQAEELKLKLSSDDISSQKRPAIEAAVKKTADTWVSGIELALGEFEKLDHLPHRMFLCGGGSSLDMVLDTLEQTDWYKSLPFTRKPTVHHIRPEQVAGIIDQTGKVTDHTFITAMGLLRVGMDTAQFSGGNEGSIRDKLDKMLSV
ncbi:MAG TPA: cell division FtsA domain-containing protein [Candidatus Saccharimonadales bacterium]